MKTLPTEIWKEILFYLKQKDIQEMAKTCKSWNEALACFLGKSLFISLKEENFQQLVEDLTHFPSMAAKVHEITIISDQQTESEILQDIVNKLNNLKAIRFTEIEIDHYLKILASEDTCSASLETIDIDRWSAISSSCKRLYIHANYNFKETITTLHFSDVQDNQALENFGGLIAYISNFPNLRDIEIHGNYEEDRLFTLDLDNLLNTCAGIKTLSIRHIGQLNYDLQSNTTPTYPSLKKLSLIQVQGDPLDLLLYIQTRFVKLENLVFMFIKADDKDRTSEDGRSNEVFSKFNAFAEEQLQTLCVVYDYNGQTYQNISVS